jgi:exosortase D (VPLPA-CTERM-specific)
MVVWWEREEYNHSYLIPLIAVFLFWQRLPQLGQAYRGPSWLGVFGTLAALAVVLIGEMSAIYTVVQYGFIALVIALVVAAFGVRGALAVWAPLAYLLFMVPLPEFLYNNLSQSLQLISSAIGVEVIRLFGISVFLEGNVIDLGSYQLQVVEACSGLRYLFPLLSFGFLVAYLFQAPFWQRALVFLSTVPITVLMNSFRIGVIGVLVEHWGIGMAEGFLHYFEGWIIFITCLAVLFGEIWVLHRFSGVGGSVWDRIDLSLPERSQIHLNLPAGWRAQGPLLACVALLAAFAVGTQGLDTRDEDVPARDTFLQFPLLHQGWLGREDHIDTATIETLKLTDYLIANYTRPDYRLPVNFYMAYYESQRKGASIHSPRSCIPGGGWVISDLSQTTVDATPGMSTNAPPLRVNRAIIQKGDDRQLVYYWFQQRGRVLTNEYLVKWYLFWDSLTQNRTDGALVRLVVPVPDGYSMEDAEAQLNGFVVDFYGLLGRYVPE